MTRLFCSLHHFLSTNLHQPAEKILAKVPEPEPLLTFVKHQTLIRVEKLDKLDFYTHFVSRLNVFEWRRGSS